ncbi:MAG TPA: DUF1080 domain-containing protein [Chthonomonas sp.]|uniref:3-keto-disaccharide hydrolase n=1 Tax=Chthonomonas sp. TaxID=2282153 RepID=UPI002B4B2510|nr:DUF1080 domain-containing protein [Chthonomonas sp.]HLI49383.1 DUF1080 domain-containing protein [Chthonomonas sp.]
MKKATTFYPFLYSSLALLVAAVLCQAKPPTPHALVKPVPPPRGAAILLGNQPPRLWQPITGTPMALRGAPAPKNTFPWGFANGVLTIKPGTGDIWDVWSFPHGHIHLEFLIPPHPKRSTPYRSGVLLHGVYEICIADSYGQPLTTQSCGALYKTQAPLVNAALPAGKWQALDIYFRAALYHHGQMVQKPIITVYLNGIRVLDHVALQSPTPEAPMPYSPQHDELGNGFDAMNIALADHGCPVRFRNIWYTG